MLSDRQETPREILKPISPEWDALPSHSPCYSEPSGSEAFFRRPLARQERELWWRAHTSVLFKRERVRRTPGLASVLVPAPGVIKPVKCVFTADYRPAGDGRRLRGTPTPLEKTPDPWITMTEENTERWSECTVTTSSIKRRHLRTTQNIQSNSA